MGPPRLPLPPGARRPCWGALKLEDGEDAPNAVDAAVTPAAICDLLELRRARLQLRLAEIRLPDVGIGLGSPKSSRRRRRPPLGPTAERHDCRRPRPPLPPPCSPTRPW